jgi:hypothetical protein
MEIISTYYLQTTHFITQPQQHKQNTHDYISQTLPADNLTIAIEIS